jgi:hypothetical protein
MNEEAKDPTQEHDEPLAEAMPDPAGPPRVVEAEDTALRGLGIAGVILVTAGGMLVPLSVATSSTQGATRSAHIEWQRRQAEIRRALDEEQATPSDRPAHLEKGSHEK